MPVTHACMHGARTLCANGAWLPCMHACACLAWPGLQEREDRVFCLDCYEAGAQQLALAGAADVVGDWA